MSNRIPRKFNKIIGKMLINTNRCKAGDIVDVVKNEFNNYILTNKNNNTTSCCFVSMLRDNSVFEVLEVQ